MVLAPPAVPVGMPQARLVPGLGTHQVQVTLAPFAVPSANKGARDAAGNAGGT